MFFGIVVGGIVGSVLLMLLICLICKFFDLGI